jgi:hypothetical protein
VNGPSAIAGLPATAAVGPTPAAPGAAGARSFGEALRAAAERAPRGGPGEAALAALREVDRARARLDEVLAQARRGRTFTAAELLCLQADAHRFAQTVEVVARAAEHAVQGVKQAVQAQV